MIALDARLRCIYEAVGFCDCIADIGSDHALLPIALLQSGKAKRAIACDINPGPLERSRKNAIKYNIKNIELKLSNGFEALEEGSFDKAAICGMGGTLISEIITCAGSKAHCGLILQPMTAYEDLRSFLWKSGFEIDDERFTVDSGKPYVVITAHYTGVNGSFTYSDLFLGKIRPDTPEFRAFCKKVCTQAEKRLKGAVHNNLPTESLEELILNCNF
jgi:tRNA (adenine22-N1)-methyltransferase